MSTLDIRVVDDPSVAAAGWLARRLRDAVRRRGSATLAVSGGSTAPPMFEALRACEMPWDLTTIWQVDERIAPDGDSDRNAEQLQRLSPEVRSRCMDASRDLWKILQLH